MPKSLSAGMICLLLKRGNWQEIRQWRMITLLSIAYKIFTKMISPHQDDWCWTWSQHANRLRPGLQYRSIVFLAREIYYWLWEPISVGTACGRSIFASSWQSQVAHHCLCSSHLYSVFVEDNATMGCFLLIQLIVPLPHHIMTACPIAATVDMRAKNPQEFILIHFN